MEIRRRVTNNESIIIKRSVSFTRIAAYLLQTIVTVNETEI